MDFSFGRTSIVAVPGTRPSLLSKSLTTTRDTPETAKLSWDMLRPVMLQIQDNFNSIADWIEWASDKLESLQNVEPEIPEIWQDQQVINQYTEIGFKVFYIKVLKAGTDLATGEGVAYKTILTPEFDGWEIVHVAAAVYTPSTSGTPTFQINNVTDNANILSTAITIDINEYNSLTAATPPVVNSTYKTIEMGDILRVDCSVAGTGTKGLDVAIVIKKAED